MVRSFLVKMALALGFLALFSLKWVDISTGERQGEYPLQIGWKAVGLPLQDISTEAWMQVNKRWMSVYELRELSMEIQNKLAIIAHAKPICGEQDGFHYASFEGRQSDGTLVVTTIQSTRSDQGNETQLGINTSHSGTIKDLRNYITGLERRIGTLGGEPHIKVLLSGEHPGKLSPIIIKEFSGRVFKKMKAEFIHSAFEAGISNQKGYSSLIQDSVNFGSKRMNVEIGTRYDPERNITQIILATPNLNDGV